MSRYTFEGLLEFKDYGEIKTPILASTGQPILVSIREAINGQRTPIDVTIIAENANGTKHATGDFSIEYMITYAIGGELQENSEFIVGGRDIKAVLYQLIDRCVSITIQTL